MPNNNFKRFDNGIQIRPGYASDPVDGKKGEIYYNTATNRLKYCVNDSPVTWTEFGPAAGTVDTSTLRWDNTAQSWVENTNIRSLAGLLKNTVSSGASSHRLEQTGASIALALRSDATASSLDFGGSALFITSNSFANVGDGAGTNRLSIDNSTGNLTIYSTAKILSNTDGSVDIGSVGANRIGNLYAKSSLNIGDTTLSGGTVNLLGMSGADITYNSDGSGNIGSPTNRPDNVYIKSSAHIGSGNEASAILEASSGTKGFLPPRMTLAQRDAIVSPAAGLLIYNTDDQEFDYFDGIDWVAVGSGQGVTSVIGDFRSLEFTAANDHVLIADHASLAIPDNFTFALWFKTSSLLTPGSIASKLTVLGDQRSYEFNQTVSGTFRATYYPGGLATDYRRRTSSVRIDDNRWHYLVATYAAGVVKLFIDGVEDTSATDSDLGTPGTSIFTSTAPLVIGGNGTDTGALLNSKISQVGVWKTSVLTSIEVTELYNQGATLRPDADCNNYSSSFDMVSWYSFETLKTGANGVEDLVGHNKGTLTNMNFTDQSVDSPKGANGIKFDQNNILFDTDASGNIGREVAGYPTYVATNRPANLMVAQGIAVGDSAANFTTDPGWITAGQHANLAVQIGVPSSLAGYGAWLSVFNASPANQTWGWQVDSASVYDMSYAVFTDPVLSKKITFKANADLIWATDGVGNIGALGATRPDKAYIKTQVKVGDSVFIETNKIYSGTDGGFDIGNASGANRAANVYISTKVESPLVSGGFASAGPIEVSSTSHATKGHVKIKDGSDLLIGKGVDGLVSAYGAQTLGDNGGPALATSIAAVVNDGVGNSRSMMAVVSSNASSSARSILQLAACRGTLAVPLYVLSNDVIGTVRFASTDEVTPNQSFAANMTCRADENWSVSAHGTKLEFNTILNGSLTSAIRLAIGGGNVLKSPTNADLGDDGSNNFGSAYINTNIKLNSLTASLPVVSDASKNLVSMSYATFAGNLDHGLLLGLADDDHAQYLLLAGRSGGQIANGGTAANNVLELRSTSHATKASILIKDGSPLVVDFSAGARTTQVPDSLLTAAGVPFAVFQGDLLAVKVGTASNTYVGSSYFHAAGTYAVPDFVTTNNLLGYMSSTVWNGTDLYTQEVGRVSFRASELHTASNFGTEFRVDTTTNGALSKTTKLLINGDGDIVLPQASDILWSTDGSGDIGADGVNRPDNVFVKTQVKVGASVFIETDKIYSGADGGFVIGNASNNRPDKIFVKTQIQNGNGTIPNPSYSFGTDTSTGFYRIGASIIGVSLGGNGRMQFESNQGFSPLIDAGLDLGKPSLRWYSTNSYRVFTDAVYSQLVADNTRTDYAAASIKHVVSGIQLAEFKGGLFGGGNGFTVGANANPPSITSASSNLTFNNGLTGYAFTFVDVGTSAILHIRDSDVFFERPILMGSSQNIIGNGDGIFNIGTSASAARPNRVHVKSEVTLGEKTSLAPISAQTTTTAYTAILTISLADTKAYKVKASVVARKTDGSKFAAYEIGILVYREGGGATIVDTQTTYESHETDTTYDARWVVAGNNLIFEARGNDTSAETVDWKGHYVMETV